MELDKSLPLAERQTLAAKRTHEMRHKATESKIRAACRGLQERGEKLTQAAIAALAGVSRQTVAKCGHILEEVSKPVTIAVLKTGFAGDTSKTNDPSKHQGGRAARVNYGVHQVTARPRAAVDPAVKGSESEDSS